MRRLFVPCGILAAAWLSVGCETSSLGLDPESTTEVPVGESGSLSAATNVALNKTVTLGGAPFFTGGWGSGQIVSPATIVDGVFLPTNTQWDQGTVWWDTYDEEERFITIELGDRCVIESFVVQADNNDWYFLDYRDSDDGSWKEAWLVPPVMGWGIMTRPNPADNTERYVLTEMITTDALRFSADTRWDRWFAVSEIQAYGVCTIEVDVDIRPGRDGNHFSLTCGGTIPVAVLTTEAFDAAAIDPATVTLGDDDGHDTPVALDEHGELMASLEDVDGDGDLDLMLHFEAQALLDNGDVDENTTELILNGETTEGVPIKGSDMVRIVS